jgi:hypothetical protein
MNTPNEFWLCAHRLAEAYDAEGLTPEERATNITDEVLAMPPTVRREALANLRTLWLHLGDLYPIVAAAVNNSEEPRGKRRGGVA